MDIVTYSNQIVARTANGVRQTYEYDGRGQLLAVKNADGTDAERYAYDKAGNMVKKMILRAGRAVSTKPPQSEDYQTTTFTFDGANQLVSSTTDGVTTKYAYDAAGRLVKEGSKTYRYGYLDKVLSVTDGKDKYTYTYHVDGQLAKATVGGDHRAPRIPQQTEDFEWDGLALVKRGGERFINEPHIGGGNPVVSSKGTSYFNDMLGTTLGAKAKGKKYSAAALTAFGESLPADTSNSQLPTHNSQTFYTGKPHVAGLGHAFLFRNYRAGLAKWQTADPMGYPDGWNQLAYGVNSPMEGLDFCGAFTFNIYDYYNRGRRVSQVGDLVIKRGGATPGACNEYCEVSLSSFTKTLTVSFYIGIIISSRAVNSAKVPIGEVVTYDEHINTPNDARITGPWVYEAIYAHECGHAAYAFNSEASLLQMRLNALEISWQAGLYTQYEVQQRAYEICVSYQLECVVGSGQSANVKTEDWFNNSPSWSLISHNGRSWAWEKVSE